MALIDLPRGLREVAVVVVAVVPVADDVVAVAVAAAVRRIHMRGPMPSTLPVHAVLFVPPSPLARHLPIYTRHPSDTNFSELSPAVSSAPPPARFV